MFGLLGFVFAMKLANNHAQYQATFDLCGLIFIKRLILRNNLIFFRNLFLFCILYLLQLEIMKSDTDNVGPQIWN